MIASIIPLALGILGALCIIAAVTLFIHWADN